MLFVIIIFLSLKSPRVRHFDFVVCLKPSQFCAVASTAPCHLPQSGVLWGLGLEMWSGTEGEVIQEVIFIIWT